MMVSTWKNVVPASVRQGARKLADSIRYAGRDPRHRFCPVCTSHSPSFRSSGMRHRAEARCPSCGALERHRLIWLFFKQSTDLFQPPRKHMLHVAPEPVFASLFKAIEHIDYLSADLFNKSAMVEMDIMNIKYPSDTFDVIYCSHVLEHVADDRQAMREFYRVLKPSGWAVLQVPIVAERTFEDASITDPAERTRVFGQADHLRNYGKDYEDRLKEAGFTVRRFQPEQITTAENVQRMRLDPHEDVFYCTKSPPTPHG